MANQDPTSARPPRRKLVAPDHLLRLLNQRLEAYGHCHNCRFVGPINPLREPEDDGRNWSRYVALVCRSGVGSGCARLAERIIADAASEYNLSAAG